MAELQFKVAAGNIKPITPGKYSMELVLLMQSLLQVAPTKRPSLESILASKVGRKYSGKAAVDIQAESRVIGTIKVSFWPKCRYLNSRGACTASVKLPEKGIN